MKVIKAEDTRSLEPFRDRIIEGALSSALRKTKMLLCLRSGPLITSMYAINVLKRPSEPLRQNSRQLAKTSYFTYPYIVACGLKNFRDFQKQAER